MNVDGDTINMPPNMEASPTREPQRLSSFVWIKGLLSALALLLLGGCARYGSKAESYSAAAGHNFYEVHFTAARSEDHSSLASVLIPVHLGEQAVVRTNSRTAIENKPALPMFTATLTTTQTPGLYQLVTKIVIREAARNKKGKLKTSKRNEGALLPIHLGVAELASPAGDPIEISVRVDRR